MVLLRVVGVVVHAQHERHVRLLGGRGDDDLLRARLEVLGGVVALGEEAGGLDHDVGARRRPRAALAGSRSANTLQLLAVDDDAVVGGLDLARERAEDRVVLEQVGERLRCR